MERESGLTELTKFCKLTLDCKIFKNFEKYIRKCPNNFVQDWRNLFVNSYGKRTAAAVAACIESRLNAISNVFIEILSLNLVNEGVTIHVTQPKIVAILGKHEVVMKFVCDNRTQIKDGWSQVNRFVHNGTNLSHLAPH